MRRIGLGILLAAVLLAGPWGCGRSPRQPLAFSLWAPAVEGPARQLLLKQVAHFQSKHPDLRVGLRLVPAAEYMPRLEGAMATGRMPDLALVPAWALPRLAASGALRPLAPLLHLQLLSDVLPSVRDQGSLRKILYGLGPVTFPQVLWANRALLDRAGIRPPAGADWPVADFDRALAALAARDPDGVVLDLGLGRDRPLLLAATLAALLRSAGANLLDPVTGRARGALDGPRALAVWRRLRHWLMAGWVQRSTEPGAFAAGRVALSLGSPARYDRDRKTLGDSIRPLPLPDFGQGSRSPERTWLWILSARTPWPGVAAEWLEYLLSPRELVKAMQVSGGVPARRRILEQTPRFRPGGPLALFGTLAARPGPTWPQRADWRRIGARLQLLLDRLAGGADPAAAARTAARAIDGTGRPAEPASVPVQPQRQKTTPGKGGG